MPDQTPVQIAWVTQDLDATEKALTALLGAKKWIRIPAVHFGPDTCTYRGGALYRDRAHPARDPGVLRLRETGASVNTDERSREEKSMKQIPETVEAADVTDYSDEVDVLVIGFGIAGGCAAVSAAAAGARVLVLERAAAAGGTSAMAGGHFYLGGGTAVQQATGHADSPEEMYSYLVAVSREPEHDKIRAYCEGSVEHFNWLEDLGFQFERSFYPGKIVVPPGTEGLSYTGNEKVWPFIERAKPAPRGHSVPVPGELGGAAIVIDLLVKRADELGVEIRYETGATNLIVEAGSVVGVSWKHFAETGAIKAKAVIIAAGGFAMNPEMVAEHTPALGQKRRTKHHGEVEPYILGNPNDDGLGIRMGVSAGGVAKNLDQMFITAAAYPPEILLTGIIVNNQGQRFVAEDSYHSRTSAFVLEQPDQAAFLIVDEAHTEMPPLPLIRFIDGWETVEEMEQALGIPEGKLVASLNRYNENAARGEDPDFHKQPEYVAAQDTGPWAAFDLSLGRAMYSGFTMGGLAVSIDGEVVREDGSTIPGLYAAGACASNIAQDGKGYSSGTQLGEGSFFGRRAGAHAARS
jgi:succinate dehydrogenase/fumarate reductase flavoprotein subunit